MKKNPSPLRRRRRALDLTLLDLSVALRRAKVSPCSVSSVHDWERNLRPIPDKALVVLARLLDCRPSEIAP